MSLVKLMPTLLEAMLLEAKEFSSVGSRHLLEKLIPVSIVTSSGGIPPMPGETSSDSAVIIAGADFLLPAPAVLSVRDWGPELVRV